MHHTFPWAQSRARRVLARALSAVTLTTSACMVVSLAQPPAQAAPVRPAPAAAVASSSSDGWSDRCRAGFSVNGGEKVKAVAAEALAGGDALVAAAVDGYDAGSLRDAVGQDRAQMVSTVHGWDARQAAWPAELAPYAKTYYGGKNLWHAPGFEQGLRNWLIRSDQPPELGAPAVPVAGQV